METIAPATIRTLLGVWAHPDDEAYLSAGLMHRVAGAGGRVVCVTATRGELGTDAPEEWPAARLAARRAEELRGALGAVGVEESRFLGHPDGGCADVPPEGPIAAIREVIDELRPDAIITFGPDGMTGHPDHIAVGQWTTEAWSSRPSGTLLYATKTRAFATRHARVHRRLGLFPPGYPRVALDDEVALGLDLDDDELRGKRAALAAHATQTEGLARLMGEAAYIRWWETEWFRRPRPAELALGAAS